MASGSEVFYKMFTLEMLEKNSVEVALTVDDPYAFEDFIKFFYTGLVLDLSPEKVYLTQY
jgi:hypothetical protein